MRVALSHRAGEFWTDRIAAKLSPRDEELLLGCEAVGVGDRFLPPLRDLKRAVGDLDAGEVADTLAEHELAIVGDSRFDRIVVELGHDATGPRPELLEVFRGPPVAQSTLRVVLRTLIVEAVADLVADDHADG